MSPDALLQAGRRWSRSALIPRAYWRARHSAVLLVVLVAPLAVGLLASGLETPSAASYAPVLAVAAIGVAVASYVDWRIEPRPASAWRTMVAALIGVPAIWDAAVPSVGVVSAGGPGWFGLLSLLVLGLAVGGWHVVDRVIAVADPLAVGLLAGTVTGSMWVGASHLPAWDPAPVAAAALATGGATGVIALIVIVRAQRELDAWARNRFQSGLVLLGTGSVAEAAGGSSAGAVVGVALLAVEASAAALLCSTVLALLRHTVLEDSSRLCELRSRIEQVETRTRQDQAVLHELKATVAGIAAANLMLHHEDSLSPRQAEDLRALVDVEVERLERLLQRSDRTTAPLEVVDLDQIIAPRVLAHSARGQEVHWQPSGARAQARADDLAEILNVVLDNAGKHARSATHVEVHERPDGVAIRIVDDGPGLPADLPLFDWGARGPRSTGQGIGLHVARELARRQGGDLLVRAGDQGGTTVVVTLLGVERTTVWEESHAA